MLKQKIRIVFAGCLGLLTLYSIHSAIAQNSLFGVPVETETEAEIMSNQREKLAQALGPYFKKNQYPTEVQTKWDHDENVKINIEYSIESDLQERADQLLKSYKPDYAAIVVMNAETGEIMALSSYEKQAEQATNWALHGQFPAASIFKVVTAGAALDKYDLPTETMIFFNGGSHTLYKKNVMNAQVNRWTRVTTLKEAFARSFNTPFGRLTFDRLKPADIEQYAIKFGFNKKISSDLPFDMGFTEIPDEKNFNLAEIASGFNKVTRMSVIQGALIAASVASEGVMPVPSIVRSIKDDKGFNLYESRPVTAATVLTQESAEKLRSLMAATIQSGTSRKSFRQLMPTLRLSEIQVGGKTGSLTGDSPKGKVDWFIGYGIGAKDEKIAVAAITVNKKQWTVKSSYLARQMIETHFQETIKKAKIASRALTKHRN